MVKNEVQQSIRQSYQKLKDLLPDFTPRRGQNFLVAEITKTLAGQYQKNATDLKIMVAEAGTGIGKSMAYLLGVVPYAFLNEQKTIISTATVALQEQLLYKDLPLFQRICDLELSIALVKGRQRYCCTHKLTSLAQSNGTSDFEQQALWDSPPTVDELALCIDLAQALINGKWDGDRDSWKQTIPNALWSQIVSDKYSCNAGRAQHRDCPFPKARLDMDNADIIVVNHSLLMADLDLGGGIILPEPKSCIYVIDEAHHLPLVARDFSASSTKLNDSLTRLQKLPTMIKKVLLLAYSKEHASQALEIEQKLGDLIMDCAASLKQVITNIPLSKFNSDGVYRFEHGQLPESLHSLVQELKDRTVTIISRLNKQNESIDERLKSGEINNKTTEPVQIELGSILQFLEGFYKTWCLLATESISNRAPIAKWLEVSKEGDDYEFHASPLEVGFYLREMLWQQATAAILVSATLRALNTFDYFCNQAGLYKDDGTQFLALSSPFDYSINGKLLIPNINCDPSEQQRFTQLLIEQLPDYLIENAGNLILFASYWQMNQVKEALLPYFNKKKWQVLVQGEMSRSELLKSHQLVCNKGKTSLIFGTNSFAEGIDLPGSLLINLVITKIPFAVPTSPVEEAYSEYIKQNGGNSFMQISVPEASRKLVQAVGRLLRKESDQGRVVILDRRLISKRYGKDLLEALPPFDLTVE